jgi:NAD-reducing hydrogenase large subunit
LDQVDPTRYAEYLSESVESDSYLKSPYFKSAGYPNGIYRVGPLARLNVIDRCGTPLADREWTEFRALRRGVILSSFHQHYARLVEILYGIERIEHLLNDPDILNKTLVLSRNRAGSRASVLPKHRGELSSITTRSIRMV